MKNIILSLALVLPLVLSAQYSLDYLQRFTESNKTGWRFSTANAANYGNIGSEAVDLSYSDGASTTRGATGLGALAVGNNSTASGELSTAMGANTIASHYISLVSGQYNSVGSSVPPNASATSFDTDNAAFVIGNGTASNAKSDAFVVYYNGKASFAGTISAGGFPVGILSPVTESGNTGVRLTRSSALNAGDIGSNAVDLTYSSGSNTTNGATGTSSISMCQNTTASGDFSTAMGLTTKASGKASTAMGFQTIASDYGTLVIGQYNSVGSAVSVNGNATAFDTDNAAFVIGNGPGSSSPRNDAFVVKFNGDATLSGDLTINSDERLKDNIQPLGSTLNKLHQIEAKTYSFKKDEEHTPKIGVLAQEVQAVFPELVKEGADGILSVNYQGLVPVLINAINEQDAKIAALEAQNEQLAIASQKIAALEEMVRFLAVQQSQTTLSVAVN